MKKDELRAQVAIAVRACQEKKAENIAVLQLDEQASGFTDYFVLCSGSNPRQVQAIADGVDEDLSAIGIEPKHREGYNQADWVLIDYVDFVVHIFSESSAQVLRSGAALENRDAAGTGRSREARAQNRSREAGQTNGREIRWHSGKVHSAQAQLQQAQELRGVRLHIAWIGRTRSAPIQSLTAEYLKRLSRFAACDAHELGTEAALLKLTEKSGRTQPVLVLLDSRGRQLTSEEIANFLEYHQSHDTQELLFAIGPADGWSDATRSAAQDNFVIRQDHAAARAGARGAAGAALPRIYDSERTSLSRRTLGAFAVCFVSGHGFSRAE